MLVIIQTSLILRNEDEIYLGRSQIEVFSVSNEHQEQGAKAREKTSRHSGA